MNDVVDFGARAVTFRGDKVNHPKVTFGESARFVTCAGLKIKFIDFDCNAASSGSSSNSFILLSNDASGAGLTASAPGQFVITDPIMTQSCEVRGINRHLIYCNSTSYCVKQFTVNDCILGFNQSNIIIHMNSSNAFIAHLAFQNSTLYSTVALINVSYTLVLVDHIGLLINLRVTYMVSVLCIMVCHTEVALLFRIVHSIMLPTREIWLIGVECFRILLS